MASTSPLWPTELYYSAKAFECGWGINETRHRAPTMQPSPLFALLKSLMSDLPNYMQRRGAFDLPPEFTFECRYGCGAAFPLESSLKVHETYHARPELRCPYYLDCKYSTFSTNKLQDHVESFHYNVNRHRCPACDFSGPTQASLTKHRKSKHGSISSVLQAKDYKSTARNSKKPTSTPNLSFASSANSHPFTPWKSSNGVPSIPPVAPSNRATRAVQHPPPIRALENDAVNWPTSPPRK